MKDKTDEYWMSRALLLADKAQAQGEIPVGAIAVIDDEVVGEGWNQSITCHDPSHHAEMQAIRQAGQKIQNYRMEDVALYVTLEPCPMCAGLLVHSRIKRLVFGAWDAKTGAAGSVMNIVASDILNHKIDVTAGVLAHQCGEKLSDFFRQRRAQIKQAKMLKKE